MRRGRGVFVAAVYAVLGGIGLLAAISMENEGPRGPFDPSAAGYPSEPEVVLHGVEIREIRKSGAPSRIFSDRATYRPLSGRGSGSSVTLEISGSAGDVTVRAPTASWDMPTGQVVLPEGASAEDNAGWTASVVSARISLAERVLTAPGKVWLNGPGLAVVGDNLVWNMREGRVALQLPKTRLEPSRAMRRRG